jgi:nitrate/TMAO reductase-like tetraheme cytochrome c subunit
MQNDEGSRVKLPEMNRRNLILISIIVIVVMVPSVFAYNYFQNNPKFCTTCHLMNQAYETWDHSAMHEVNCHTCHEAGIVEGLGHVVDVITKNPQEVTRPTEVDNEICETCHTSEDPKWLQVVNTAGHKVHFFGSGQPPDCIDCHGIQLHVFEPPEEACDECHETTTMMGTPEMHIHCLVCHEFTVQDESLFPEHGECAACHEEKETMEITFPTNAHANTTCLNCHNPHVEEQQTDCVTCHDGPETGLHQLSAHGNCESCHVPHSSEDMRDVCVSCHTDKDEHYAPTECATCHSFGS